jgi:hypothetical protein
MKISNLALTNVLLKEKKLIFKNSKRRIHFQPPNKDAKSTAFDSFQAHSPMNISRGKTEEFKSRLFLDSPQVPNRSPKYAFLFTVVMTTWTVAMDKSRKRQKAYLQEQDRMMFRQILPFVQAMEDLRYTAVEMKNYIINKAIADQYSPYLFQHLRKRFNQEDVLIQEIVQQWRNIGSGSSYPYNHGIDPSNKKNLRSFNDKGLFDNREVGFTY